MQIQKLFMSNIFVIVIVKENVHFAPGVRLGIFSRRNGNMPNIFLVVIVKENLHFAPGFRVGIFHVGMETIIEHVTKKSRKSRGHFPWE